MKNQLNAISDAQITAYIEQNNLLGWRFLYDKYALNMYVAILWVLNDEKQAEETLNKVFTQLKNNKEQLNIRKSLSTSLLYHAYTTALEIKKIRDLKFNKTYTISKSSPTVSGWINRPFSPQDGVKLNFGNLDSESIIHMLRPELN